MTEASKFKFPEIRLLNPEKAQGNRIAFDISGSDDPAEAHNIVYSVTEAYDHTIHDYTTGKDVGDVIVNGVGLPEPVGLEIG
jgi:hypothetical protein